MNDAFEQDREDMAAGEGMFAGQEDANLEPIVLADRESTEQEVDEALLLESCDEGNERVEFHQRIAELQGFSPLAERDRALKCIRKASEQVAEGAFLMAELRERGIL